MIRHFLEIDQLSPATLRGLLNDALYMKREIRSIPRLLEGRAVALVFEKPSTRTRVSFERGIHQLGGQAIVLSAQDMALGHGETIADTARVLSRYVDVIMLRTTQQKKLLQLAASATVPVINGLTEVSHPCQILADLLTFEERKGSIEGKKIAWIGDCNNVAKSWIQAAPLLGFQMEVACPIPFWGGSNTPGVRRVDDPFEAAAGADAILTDVFVSMNDKDTDERRALLGTYRVDEALMARAKPDAIFMHCLPARRGEEVTDAVIDGPQSAVWDEAENRMHAQKAILAWCVSSGTLAATHPEGRA